MQCLNRLNHERKQMFATFRVRVEAKGYVDRVEDKGYLERVEEINRKLMKEVTELAFNNTLFDYYLAKAQNCFITSLEEYQKENEKVTDLLRREIKYLQNENSETRSYLELQFERNREYNVFLYEDFSKKMYGNIVYSFLIFLLVFIFSFFCIRRNDDGLER